MLTVFTCQTDLFRCFVVSLFCCFVVCCCFLESSPSKHPLGCSSLTEKVEKVDKQSNNGFLVFFVFLFSLVCRLCGCVMDVVFLFLGKFPFKTPFGMSLREKVERLTNGLYCDIHTDPL